MKLIKTKVSINYVINAYKQGKNNFLFDDKKTFCGTTTIKELEKLKSNGINFLFVE